MKKLKKILLPLATAILVIAISIGATLAYLKDEATADNVMTVGKIDIDLLEYERIDTETANDAAKVKPFDDDEGAGRNSLLPAVIAKDFKYTTDDEFVDWTQPDVNWQQKDKVGYTSPIWDPAKINNEVDKMVFLKNNGDYGAYVRIYFAFEAGAFTDFDDFRKMIHLNLNETDAWEWEWKDILATNNEGGTYFIAKATYQKELLPGDFTDITLSQIALDPTATNEQVDAFGDTYEVFVNAQGIQSAGFKTPEEALSEGFGDKLPFTNIVLTRGIPLKTALHNFKGKESKPITDKVATVTFGLNENYAETVKGHKRTFSSVEQDADVYTYYLPNADDSSKYDLYVLADSKIYTPKDSTGLFKEMAALKKVDTTNMDTSRTENMSQMFYNCVSISDLNVSTWDVSKVTTFNSFLYCAIDSNNDGKLNNYDTYNYQLTSLNVSNWNTGSAVDMSSMFRGCSALLTLDVDGWDVSKVETFERFLYRCRGLQSINLEGWQTTSAKNMIYMFYECWTLKKLDLTNWQVGTVETMAYMFDKCTALEELYLKDWDVRKVSDMAGIFYRCEALPTLDISGWETESVVSADSVFMYCYALKEITFGDGWDMSKVTNLESMFNACEALLELDVANWNVSNVTSFYLMFQKCTSLTELDLSGWNTQNVIESTKMFSESNNLVKIYVGDGWDTSGIPSDDSSAMFNKCTSLVGGNGTKYNSKKTNKEYARVDAAGTPGYLTHINDKPADTEETQ